MKVVIELHEAFRSNYEEDKFEASLRRLYDDMVATCADDDYSASGNYELELLHELLRAFPKSCQNDDKSGEWIDRKFHGFADGKPVYNVWECSVCGEEHYGVEDTLTPYCPYCGAKMEERSDEK